MISRCGALGVAYVISAAIAALLVDVKVPHAYMVCASHGLPDSQDEIFHIPQLLRFYHGDFTWDAKITTPPGLYAVTLALWWAIQPLKAFTGADAVVAARGTNTLALLMVPWLCSLVRRGFEPNEAHGQRRFVAYACATLPPLWFFGFLYYTDVLSVCSILAMLAATEHERHAVASLVRSVPR